MKNPERKTYTMAEVKSHFLPNSIMNRMEEEFANLCQMRHPWQRRLTVNKENRRAGSLEGAKGNILSVSQIKNWLPSFYLSENWTIVQDEPLMVKDTDSQIYFVSVIETASSFVVSVTPQSLR